MTDTRFAERAARYLEGDGLDAVHRYVRANGLPLSLLDDLVQEVLVRVLLAEGRGVEPDSVEAFVTTLVRRTAVDLVRGRLRRPEGHLVRPADDEDPLADVAAPDDPSADVVTAEDLAQFAGMVDDVRRTLARRLDRTPDRAAGALVVVAIAHGDAVPADDCPRPAGGVAASEGIAWAGLFYGGADRCFPAADDPEDAAMRQRRSRALACQRALLRDAAAGLGAALGVDDA